MGKKSNPYTGGKMCARPVTMNRSMYFQLIRKIRNAGKEKGNGKKETVAGR